MAGGARGDGLTRGRPPALSAVAAREELRLLIGRAQGKPCPTSHDLATAMQVGERLIYATVIAMRAAGELQVLYSAAGQRNRRMRVMLDGHWSEWTDWTARNRYQRRRRGDQVHIDAVKARGGYG